MFCCDRHARTISAGVRKHPSTARKVQIGGQGSPPSTLAGCTTHCMVHAGNLTPHLRFVRWRRRPITRPFDI